jgi:MinD-like ATPase involved in chromosome partitioning or flagellar assembly
VSGVTLPEPEIALVLSPDAWVDTLHRYCADHGGARVRCMVLDPAVALEEDFDVLVTSDRWPALTRPFVDALHARGRRVLVVSCDPEAGELAVRLGADAVADPRNSAADLVAAAVAIAPARVGPTSANAPTGPVITGAPARRVATGIIAVGGPFGAGSTEVAIALAATSARRRHRAVLVDADEVTPSVAARLGLPLEPNLCSAVDAVAYGLGAVPGALFDLGDGWPAVLVGAPSRRAASALRPADVVAVGAVLAERFAPVVFDISAGPSTPDLGTAGAVASTADVVVAVGAATPVGVVRLLEWLRELAAIAPSARVHVAVNRAPSARTRRAELAAELQRAVPISGLTFLPADPRVEEAAWAAALVERGPFARAIEPLHEAVTHAASLADRIASRA